VGRLARDRRGGLVGVPFHGSPGGRLAAPARVAGGECVVARVGVRVTVAGHELVTQVGGSRRPAGPAQGEAQGARAGRPLPWAVAAEPLAGAAQQLRVALQRQGGAGAAVARGAPGRRRGGRRGGVAFVVGRGGGARPRHHAPLPRCRCAAHGAHDGRQTPRLGRAGFVGRHDRGGRGAGDAALGALLLRRRLRGLGGAQRRALLGGRPRSAHALRRRAPGAWLGGRRSAQGLQGQGQASAVGARDGGRGARVGLGVH